MIKALLEGKPFGHPLHPLLVHLPIGLLYLSLLLDAVTLFFESSETLVRGAFYSMLFALVMALVAALPGFVDRADIRDDHPAKKTANTHMVLNITVVALTALNLVLRYGALTAETTPIAPFVLSLIAVALVSYSGYLGGILVYGDGIAVGRHRRHGDTPEETIRPAASAAAIGPQVSGTIAIAEAGALEDGETLRAEVGGVVLTIAKVEGQLYAFQEFCTHRFGPLSEGHFHGHEIMCPWHNSCFDVRDGKVTKGPAKVALKTFDVLVEDGWIRVRVEQKAAN